MAFKICVTVQKPKVDHAIAIAVVGAATSVIYEPKTSSDEEKGKTSHRFRPPVKLLNLPISALTYFTKYLILNFAGRPLPEDPGPRRLRQL